MARRRYPRPPLEEVRRIVALGAALMRGEAPPPQPEGSAEDELYVLAGVPCQVCDGILWDSEEVDTERYGGCTCPEDDYPPYGGWDDDDDWGEF